MNITDEMIERATEAIKDRARRGAIKYTNGKITVMDIDLACAALTAALGDVEPEPLEDVLGPYEPAEVVFVPTYDGELGARGVIASWEAIIRESGAIRVHVGHGPTIAAAVANATKDGDA